MLKTSQYKDMIARFVENRTQKTPSLSIIIVTYNKGKDVLACLKSLESQSTNDYEVIVVDNGETEAYVDIITKLPLLYIQLKKNYGVTVGRNIGTLHSRSNLLFFGDDDCLIDQNCNNNYITLFKANQNIVAARGIIRFKSDSIYNYLQGHYDRGNKTSPFFLDIEGNCAIRKDALSSVGGWNENIWGHEGLELSYRLAEKYGRDSIVYYPDAIIYHDYSDSLLKLVKKDLRHHHIKMQLDQKYPQLRAFTRSYKITSTPNKSNPTSFQKFKVLCINAIRLNINRRPIVNNFLYNFIYQDKRWAFRGLFSDIRNKFVKGAKFIS